MSTFFVSLAACKPGENSVTLKATLFSRLLRTLATQLFRVGNQRAIDLHPVAILHVIGQFDRTAINSDFIFRQIDIAT